jgi:shikimate dehydrogenase
VSLRNGHWPSGATRFAGVIGDPVRHSLSPRLHNAAYAALGLDWAYGAFTVDSSSVKAAIFGAASLGFVGLSVTMPHKEAAALIADESSTTVERLKAANTLSFAHGRVLASSTDGEGLLADLEGAGFDPQGADVVVIGAGGAARAVVLALAEARAQTVTVVNRTEERAKVAAMLAGSAGRTGDAGAISKADLIVKATPSGITDEGYLGSLCGPGQLALDLVYDPPLTPFLAKARQAGAKVRNGLGMLVHQAAAQVTLWTGQAAPLEAMWDAVGGPDRDLGGSRPLDLLRAEGEPTSGGRMEE